MSKIALHLIASLTLALAATSAHSALVQFHVSAQGNNINPYSDWLGPGPLPTSVELSLVIDTLEFTSFTYTVSDELKAFRFEGVEAQSISLLADGVNLWTDPENTTFALQGNDNNPHAPNCFCGLRVDSAAGEHIFIELWTDPWSAFDPLVDDPLAHILLQRGPPGIYTYSLGVWGSTGGWGSLGFRGQPTVSAVPSPPAVWLLATGLAGLGGRRWLRRQASRRVSCF